MTGLVDRDFDRDRDLPSLVALVAKARGSGDPHAFYHPGGLQWLLRRLGRGPFDVRQWDDPAGLSAAVIDDAGYAILVSADPSLDRYLWLLDRAEAARLERGDASIETSLWDADSELLATVRSRGYAPTGTYSDELVHDRLGGAGTVRLPDGFQMRWLEPELDDAYVELHRAAWSTVAPSPYRREIHDVVTAMPAFDRRLVPIVAAPDGTLAAYCISWLDPLTRTVEIEPLGTRPEYRRLGLGRAIVDEVVRRAAERDGVSVLVWGSHGNVPARRLYESAGFTSRRTVREYRRALRA